MISPFPGATTLKPGSATFPLPGIGADIVDDAGRARSPIPGGGYLVLTRPWPSMLRGIWGDPRAVPRHVLESLRRPVLRGRRRQARRGRLLLAARPGRRRDARLGTQHLDRRGRARARRASRGRRGRRRRHEGRHHGPGDQRVRDPAWRRSRPSDALVAELRDHVAHTIGPIAKPKKILFTEDLPKTRSGKIMRRLLRDVAEDQALGDTTTLADPSVVEGIKSRYLAIGADRRGLTIPSDAPEHWTWHDGPSSPDRARSSTSTACCPTRRAVSTTSSGPAATGTRSSRPVVTTTSSKR